MSQMSQRLHRARLAIGARVFGLIVLSAPVLWTRDTTAALALVAIGTIWLAATTAEMLRLNRTLAFGAESALIGFVCALSLDSSLAVLGSLAIPPFTAALRRGVRGMLLALSVELVALVPLSTALRGTLDAEASTGVFTWVMVGIGLGLIGSFVHSTLRLATDSLTPYRDARALIRELIDLSGGLSSGLDPVSLATTVASRVRDELPVTDLVVLVPVEDGLRPLVTEVGTVPEALDALEVLATATSRSGQVARSGSAFAFPLTTDAGVVAVVAGLLPPGLAPDAMRLGARLDDVAARLQPTAVHLDTALLFTAFRDTAASHERRRLAREMHDGIAQDIASLGYLVDGLAARPSSPEQAVALRLLRDRISVVVAEVRRSVQSLRSEVGASESLGSAVSRIARHLGESSGRPIHVTVEEGTARLRSEVEGELLRIAQEAMTNAVRHARARRIDVTCRVQAPDAEIVVRDDGHGLGAARTDSQGIEIMHERALLAGAELTIREVEPHGTEVRVATSGHLPAGSDTDEKVTA